MRSIKSARSELLIAMNFAPCVVLMPLTHGHVVSPIPVVCIQAIGWPDGQ
jgi:hypothetical protein